MVRAEAEAEADAGPEAVTPSDFQTNDDVGAAAACPATACSATAWPAASCQAACAFRFALRSSPEASKGCTEGAGRCGERKPKETRRALSCFFPAAHVFLTFFQVLSLEEYEQRKAQQKA